MAFMSAIVLSISGCGTSRLWRFVVTLAETTAQPGSLADP